MTVGADFIKCAVLATLMKGVLLDCTGTYTYWSGWSTWSQCSVTCGGGFKTRTFNHIYGDSWWSRSCTHLGPSQKLACNQNCMHGLFGNDKCVCHPGYKGTCCEVEPVCNEPCKNGGSCVGEDMCKCPQGFYGRQCEIGSQVIAESLRPRFNPVLDPDDVYKEESWYDGPIESGFNRVCYIKVETQNAPGDAIVTAVSYKDGDNDSRIIYGNFSTGPVDSHGDVIGHSRFACLQVRCPGWTIDGTSFNVNVDVTIQSTSGRCNVTSVQRAVLLTNATNRMSLTLVEGYNYGPQFGIYYASGYRQQAEYLSEHVCYSGRQYDFGSLNPSVGVVATFNC